MCFIAERSETFTDQPFVSGRARDCSEADGVEEVQPRGEACEPWRLQSAVMCFVMLLLDPAFWSQTLQILRSHSGKQGGSSQGGCKVPWSQFSHNLWSKLWSQDLIIVITRCDHCKYHISLTTLLMIVDAVILFSPARPIFAIQCYVVACACL